MSLQLSSKQSIADVWIAQLDRKRVPQVRSSGCTLETDQDESDLRWPKSNHQQCNMSLNVMRLCVEKLRNEQIQRTLNQKEILCKSIQQGRLAWFGHVERTEDNRIPHRVLHCYITGNRSRRRQRKTWMDNVKEDLRMHNTDIRDVTDMTEDRTTWEESCTNSSSV